MPIVAASLAIAALLAVAGRAEDVVRYNRDVRPILFDACVSCHGPDSASREADLRLDVREQAVDMGAITPGDPESSEMLRRILSDDPDEQMPPPELKKTLTAEQKEILERWIAEGAAYEPLWSHIPPRRPDEPDVADADWPRNGIDRFILAKLVENGLAPVEEADRRTLARRASLDLVGLPPTVEQLAEFLADDAPDAYERYVERLLASPRWGEHRARYWLDAARYADTHGIHFDNYREMWSYRDWVIRAFNQNMPFDQFTIENLAGDLLPEATLEQKIGSGFNRCNITTNEGGIIDEEYVVLYARDRTETTSQVWLGLTAGCAVCHDHKFDPLSQREFYELSAFFNNTTQEAKDGNVKDTPPIVRVPLVEDRARWSELVEAIPTFDRELAERREGARGSFERWLASIAPGEFAKWLPLEGLQLHAPLNDGDDSIEYRWQGESRRIDKPASVEWRPGRLGPQGAYLSGGAVLAAAEAGDFENDQPFAVAAWIKIPAKGGSAAVLARMDEEANHRGWDLWIEGRRIGTHLINSWPKNALKVVTREPIPANEWVHAAVVYDGRRDATTVRIYVNGVVQPTEILANSLSKTIRTETPLKLGQRRNSSPLTGSQVEDVRVYSRALDEDEVLTLATTAAIASATTVPPAERPAADLEALYAWWSRIVDERGRELFLKQRASRSELTAIESRGTLAHVMQERPEPPKAYILNRGEYDQRRDEVTPATPAFLPPMPADLPRNRLGLAQWLLCEENPLTARVTVNRYWQEAFGQGLVRTAGDFGMSGELPSHPELLDWLAIEFRESGWDVKHMFRLLVTSSAYRQSALVSPAARERDPDNRLLSRGPRFRMDGEMIRDYALAASGMLSPKIGGPSVKPYQPPGVWEAVAMIGSNTRDYKQDSGESLYRRSLYTFWKRSAPPASLETFNAPSRENCTVVRERTNTPLQALVTLNDPQFVEAARRLAQRAIHEAGGEFNSRTEFLAQRVLCRPLLPEERQIIRSSFEALVAHYAVDAADAQSLITVGESSVDATIPPAELASWTMVVNQLFNLDEALNK
ncbi:MAG: DUF1553 domain-containing protein [Pirellulales bacterium]|nr:DUF1553 domain-containing protein [Pirellulales bacterium]